MSPILTKPAYLGAGNLKPYLVSFNVNFSHLFGNNSLFSDGEEVILILCIGCGAAAFLLNIVVLLVFLRNASSVANSGIRILTVTEIMYTGTRVVSDSLLYAHQFSVFPIFCCIVSTTLCIRNWWFATITVCRCIAIFLPLKAKHILTVRRQIFVYIAIAVPSIAFSILRNVWMFQKQQSSMDLPLFLFQGGVPVPIVVITSIIMVSYLLGSPRTNLPRAHYTVRRATRTVLSLAIMFAFLESPGFIMTALGHAGVLYHPILDVISNLTSILDSLTNFLVFLVSSKNFKLGLMNLLTGKSNSTRLNQNQFLYQSSLTAAGRKATGNELITRNMPNIQMEENSS